MGATPSIAEAVGDLAPGSDGAGTIAASSEAGAPAAVIDTTLVRVPVAATRSRRRVMPRTTPAWLRLAAAGIALGSVLLAITGARLAVGRADATRDVVLEATPLLVDSQDLYVALADADAAASTAFLQAGLEPPELRGRYDDDVALAGEKLAAIAGHGGLSGDARGAVEHITEQLPVYSGLVADARANNRQDFPVGAAYLRQASKLMRDEILPAAKGIYDEAGEQLHAGYGAGTSAAEVSVWTGVVAVVVAALLVAQVFVTRRTRRVLNLGLLAATVLIVSLAAWTANALTRERRELIAAQREGSDLFLVLSNARILTLRAVADENLDLIERGTEPTYMADFDAVTGAVGGEDSGLLAWAGRIADDIGIGGEEVAAIGERYERFMAVHDGVRSSESDGEYNDAVALAVDDEAEAAAQLDLAYAESTGEAHDRLTAAATDARQALRGLPTAMALVALFAGLLAVAGLDRRIREYR